MKTPNEYEIGTCRLCGREPIEITAHHLIPKTTHSNKYVKKNFTSDQVVITVDLCRACHKTVHATFTEKELSRSYYTFELLSQAEPIAKFSKWVGKQSVDRRVKVSWTNDRRAKNG